MWYGGGCDLTPFYVQEEDFAEFHAFWKGTCDRHDAQVRRGAAAALPPCCVCCVRAVSTHCARCATDAPALPLGLSNS